MGWKWKKLSAQFCQSLEVTNSPNNLQTPKQPWIILRPIHFKCYQYSYFLYKSCYDGLLLRMLSHMFYKYASVQLYTQLTMIEREVIHNKLSDLKNHI